MNTFQQYLEANEARKKAGEIYNSIDNIIDTKVSDKKIANELRDLILKYGEGKFKEGYDSGYNKGKEWGKD